MTTATLKEKINLSHAKALKRAREMMKMTRVEMARRLNLSIEADRTPISAHLANESFRAI